MPQVAAKTEGPIDAALATLTESIAALATPLTVLTTVMSGPMVAGAAAATTAVTAFGRAAAGVNGPLNAIGGSLNKLAGSALAPLTAAINVYTSAATGSINLIQTLVAKANPAAAFQFNRALDDLAATMGQILTPVLEAITGFVREFADVLQGMKPALDPIMQGISMIIGELSTLIAPLAELLMPVFEMLSSFITNIIVPAIHFLVDALKSWYAIVKDFMRAIGIEFNDFQKGNSKGAAVRPASYGSIEDIGKRTTMNALNQGRSTLTPDGTAIVNQFDKLGNIIDKGFDKILEKLGVGKETRDQIKKVAPKNAFEGMFALSASAIRSLFTK